VEHLLEPMVQIQYFQPSLLPVAAVVESQGLEAKVEEMGVLVVEGLTALLQETEPVIKDLTEGQHLELLEELAAVAQEQPGQPILPIQVALVVLEFLLL
jgi:hypothetical protein